MPDADLQADLELLRHHAAEAGRIAMRWFGDNPQVWLKEGESPVSEADFAVDEYLKRELMAARPDYGWLSEETEDTSDRTERRRVFVVDPIDGTRGFLAGDQRWCISIAIVENNRPVVGILESPVLKRRIDAVTGGGAFENGRPVVPRPERQRLRVAGPKVFMRRANSMRDVMEHLDHAGYVPSLAWRLALVATGEIDIGFARASARDWDLAAADLIVHEAGARLTGEDCAPLLYNCPSTRHGILVAARDPHHAPMCEVATRVQRDG